MAKAPKINKGLDIKGQGFVPYAKTKKMSLPGLIHRLKKFSEISEKNT